MKMRKGLLVFAFAVGGMAWQALAGPQPSSTLTTTNMAPALNSQQPSQADVQPLDQDQNSRSSPSASTKTNKKGFYWFTTAPKESQPQTQWYGKISSRPWDAPGWHVGQTQFADGEHQGPGLALLEVDCGK
ncbi:MAG TPA: hypothetical protein VGI03_00580 [Verrucomicrobiae bacterium]|jgi:hypothetical protein